MLMSAEIGLGAVFGRSLWDQVAIYQSPSGVLGLAAQVIFATFPVTQMWRRFDQVLDRQHSAAL